MNATALRIVILVAAIAAAAATARLGWWQWDRAAQKEALQAAIDTRAALPPAGAAELAATVADGGAALLHRQVVVRGHWLAERTLFLDNRVMNARPGFIVVTPLQWPGGTVLVQRGWVARDAADRTRLPQLADACRRSRGARARGRAAVEAVRVRRERVGRDPAESRSRRLRLRDRSERCCR